MMGKKNELEIEDFPLEVGWRFLFYLTPIQKGRNDLVTAEYWENGFWKLKMYDF